jgi:2-oxoglutarate ferredoxin oxidoreductase subunit alpha
MTKNENVIDLEYVVVRFSGDSGDGMQLAGTLFSNLSAILGNEISTFPDFPSEIRAPQGTLGGVSGFQVCLGANKVYTPGDKADVLVAMNPAALKVNVNGVKKTGVIIIDSDSFQESDLEKAEFKTNNPFEELGIPDSMQIVRVPLTSMTKASLEGFDLDYKAILRCKNMFALGFICFLFNRSVDQATQFLGYKFKKKPEILKANVKVLVDGFNYGQNIDASITTFRVDKSHEMQPGRYTNIEGNKATAWGLIAASKKANKELFLGSYPITPATDILHELAARKDMGVKVIQAEDEIAGICTAIGAAFGGNLAATSTSGPGLALKSEAIGLAVMSELPLVVIDVMRGGPSTGLPTKTEQTDLAQALYGRNGESPVVVLAASTPANCFDYAFAAAKIALEHMTPVILLTDSYLGNGASLWKIPKLADLTEIKPSSIPSSFTGSFNACKRDEETKVRYWAFPGMEGYTHRNGGLEKDYDKGSLSTVPGNHEKMVNTRAAKVAKVADYIPELKVEGDPDADLLIIGWGSTHGHLMSTICELNKEGKKVALAHFNYINPLPKNASDVIRKYKKNIVCELNSGQFVDYLRTKIQGVHFNQYNKIQGQPFTVSELKERITKLLEE